VKGIPLIPTLLVGLACAAMIALGVWQLERRGEKAGLLTLYRANLNKPEINLPNLGPVADAVMFRKTTALCLSVKAWQVEGGRSSTGRTGFRWIAECSTGAEGPGLIADMGVAQDPKAKPVWTGGTVSGRITREPDHGSLIGKLFGASKVLRPMIVAETAPAGLLPSQPPDPDEVPNNHLAYAVQWFLFSAIAALIYVLALRRRNRA
jgi:surfeit locus 1 family protein